MILVINPNDPDCAGLHRPEQYILDNVFCPELGFSRSEPLGKRGKPTQIVGQCGDGLSGIPQSSKEGCFGAAFIMNMRKEVIR